MDPRGNWSLHAESLAREEARKRVGVAAIRRIAYMMMMLVDDRANKMMMMAYNKAAFFFVIIRTTKIEYYGNPICWGAAEGYLEEKLGRNKKSSVVFFLLMPSSSPPHWRVKEAGCSSWPHLQKADFDDQQTTRVGGTE